VTDAVLVVPGSYRGEQLGLVLGLAQEAGIQVRRRGHAAAATSDRRSHTSTRASTNPELPKGEDAFARSEESLITTGLASLTEAFARRISELFVRATRFDPLHRAETEQALYDNLPGWLEQLRAQERVEATLMHHDKELKTVLERDSVLGVAAGFYRAVVQLISYHRQAGRSVAPGRQRLATLPLAAELARLDDTHVELAPGMPPAPCRSTELIDAGNGQVKLLKRLAGAHRPPIFRRRRRPPSRPTADRRAPCRLMRLRRHRLSRRVRGLVVGREPVDGRRVIVIADQASGVSRAHCDRAARRGAQARGPEPFRHLRQREEDFD
jgi:hypothetical protein